MALKENLKIRSDPKVKEVFDNYPQEIREKLMFLRKLIVQTAEESKVVKDLEETLKWGEPSYLTKHGSTIRIDWKEKNPDQYSIYFKCTSKLVPTFKMIFGDTFKYENNRAIFFELIDGIPEFELKSCIHAALTYHKIKHLPNLGIERIGAD